MAAPFSLAAAHWLRSKGWSIDRGMWIFNGDTFCGFTLEAAVARQRGRDLAEWTARQQARAETIMASIG